MDGFAAPVFLLFISLVPLIPAYVWFRIKKYGSLRFLLSVLAGVLTVLAAGLIQFVFPLDLSGQGQMKDLLFGVFIRVSLVEESSRVMVLFLLFYFIPYSKIIIKNEALPVSENREVFFFGAPSGLVAGLGFAAGENIFYGLVNPGAVFLRFFTAVLHGACGARIGAGLCQVRRQPLRAFSQFFSAVLIHGTYNFCVLNPGIPWFLSIFISLSALFSSLTSVYFGDPGLSAKPNNKETMKQ